MGERLDVLLIGGTGFLGGHVTRGLALAGHRVTTLSHRQRPVENGVASLTADRRDPASLARALEGRRFDLTVDFLVYDAADVEALLFVPYAALGRYVMISTGQVYLVTQGATPPFREPDVEGPVTAEPEAGTPDHAEWRYGAGKRRAERILAGLRATHGVRAVALRLPIVQGESDGSLRLWAYLERLLDGGPLVLPEGGVQPVRFVDADDVARAVVWLAESPSPRVMAYNLAQPDVIPLREFLERLAREAGLRPRFVEASWEEARGAGLDESFSPYAGRWRSILDPAAVAAEWGLVGHRTEEYLPRVARWHLENRPRRSHAGYAQRARELALAGRLGAGAARVPKRSR